MMRVMVVEDEEIDPRRGVLRVHRCDVVTDRLGDVVELVRVVPDLVEQAQAGDLVISADIPLAARLLAKQVEVITPRGQPMTEANIGERLAIRDFLDTLRGSGIQSGGPAAMSPADKQQFANALDRWLVEAQRRNPPQKG